MRAIRRYPASYRHIWFTVEPSLLKGLFRPDKTVEKQSPDGKLIESFPPVNDKGKLRSAYSDKLKTDKVKLPPSPEFSKVVRMIFDWFVLEDRGIKRIAAKLNSMGIPAPRGRKWFQSSVRGTLLNPAHKGALV